MADQNVQEYVDETIHSIKKDLEDPDKSGLHCYEKIQKPAISSTLDGEQLCFLDLQRPGTINDMTSVPDSTTHLQPRPMNDGYTLLYPGSSAEQRQNITFVKSKPTNIVKRELKDGYLEFETFGRPNDEETDSSDIQSTVIQISSDGYLTPAPVSRQSEERSRIEEHHYSSIYDTNDIENRRNENNSACVSKKICRILCGLFIISLNVVFIIVIAIYLLYPELKGEQKTALSNTTVIPSTSNKASGSGDVKFIFVNESLIWPNAVTYCRRIHGGTLADVFINTKTTSIEIPQYTRIWVGRYSTYTNWTSITGCYSYTVTDVISPITISMNSVADCQHKCSNHRFIALRGTHCFCLTREPRDLDGSMKCTLKCKGDATNMCGGYSAVTVYEKVSDNVQISTLSAESQHRCGSIGNTRQIVQRDCSIPFQALCKNHDDRYRNELHVNLFLVSGQLVDNGYYSWDKSRELCNFHQGNLVDVKEAKTVDFSDSTWIGLFKPSKNFTVEESQPISSTVITCTDYLNGDFNILNSQDCISLKKPFICKIG